MSVTKPVDGWDRNAAKLLRRRILEGSPDGVNYSPDWIASTSSSPARPGPNCIVIAQILQCHAALWAHTMRELHANGHRSVDDGRAEWLRRMREADAEIKRHMAGPGFTTGAAA